MQQPGDAIWTFDDWRPTVTSPDGRFTMSLRARLQVDAGVFGQSDDIDTVTLERNAVAWFLELRDESDGYGPSTTEGLLRWRLPQR